MKEELTVRQSEYFEVANELIKKYDIEWTMESVDFVLNKLNVSFDETITYTTANLVTILVCGEKNHDRKRACELIDEARKLGISPAELHLYLVHVMQGEHFFMDTVSLKNFVNLLGSYLKRNQ